MPRIQAASNAEQREHTRRTLLDAAHTLLAEAASPPSMGEVAAAAGVARATAYQYFGSRHELLQAMVHDVFPRWAQRVTSAMDACPDPGDKVLAYARTNVELVAEGSHAVGSALATLAPGAELNEQAERMHRAVAHPLIAALRDLGLPHPEDSADLVNATVHSATQWLEGGRPAESVLDSLTSFLAALTGAPRPAPTSE